MLRDYFYVILSGTLDVIVETPNIKTVIDQTSLKQEAIKYGAPSEVIRAIDLAEWAVQDDLERHLLGMPSPEFAWTWDKGLFPDGLADTIRTTLERNEPIAIRVPVTVRKRGLQPRPSYFDIHIKRNGTDESARPWFIRNGILISDVRAPQMRSLTSIVVVDDEPLSELLRFTENPSHTMWQSQQAKKNYAHGVMSDISFVVNSVRAIYDLAMAEDKKEDRRLLSDIFFIPGKEIEPPTSGPQYARVNKIASGFTITQGKDLLPKQAEIEIRIAYDVRRRSALKAYRTTDFEVNKSPIKLSEPVGCTILDSTENRIRLQILNSASFRLDVTGFDQNRQIFVAWTT